MGVPNKHILEQLPVIGALGRTAAAAVWQRLSKADPGPAATPTTEIHRELPPRSSDLIRAFVRHVGGDPGAYRHTVPPHLFPQWSFGPASRTLQGLPYPLLKGLNFGCRMDVRAPLPADEALEVSAWLENVDDNGRRAILEQRVVTGTKSQPDALHATLYVYVPLGGNGETNRSKRRKDKPRVPEHAREAAFWRIGPKAGLDFAKLTGDFNPVHWIPAYARAFGFRNTILHGFSTFARAVEGLQRDVFKGTAAIRLAEVRFTRPLVLPASVGLYIDGEGGVWVGDAPGGPAYMAGTYECEPLT